MADAQQTLPDIKGFLDPLPVDKTVKADIWDAYHQAGDQADFQRRFDKLSIPKNVKADLWDLRYGGGRPRPDISEYARAAGIHVVDQSGKTLSPGTLPPVPGPRVPQMEEVLAPSNVIPKAKQAGSELLRSATSPIQQQISEMAGTPKPPTMVELYDPAMATLVEKGKKSIDTVFGVGTVAKLGQDFPWAEYAGHLANETARAGLSVMDFGTTPLGLATTVAAPGALPASPRLARALSAGYGASMVPTTVEAAKEAYQHPDAETVPKAVVQTALNLLPLAATVPLLRNPADVLAERINRHNAEAAKLVAQERKAGMEQWPQQGTMGLEQTPAELAQNVHGEPVPVVINGKPHTIQLAGVDTKTGRPGFKVVDESGKTVFGGTGPVVQGWVRRFASPEAPEGTPAGATGPLPGTAPGATATARLEAWHEQAGEFIHALGEGKAPTTPAEIAEVQRLVKIGRARIRIAGENATPEAHALLEHLTQLHPEAGGKGAPVVLPPLPQPPAPAPQPPGTPPTPAPPETPPAPGAPEPPPAPRPPGAPPPATTPVETPTTPVEGPPPITAPPPPILAPPEPDGLAASKEHDISGHQALADAIFEKLSAGETIGDNRALTELADVAFKGTRASGAYTSRDSYDAMEMAINQWVIVHGQRLLAMEPQHAVDELRTLLQRLPTQADRTQEQVDLQQFSTPPTLAYAATRALAPQLGEVVLEPSAGTGGLASWARASGAQVQTNEIAPRRLAMLRALGFEPTEVDAEKLHDFLTAQYPDMARPTAILMNPPFSATGGRVEAHKNKYGLMHVEQALQRLAEGGRLVAIMGRGVGFDFGGVQEWWKKIAGQYTVLANISMPGKEYQKYGTTFDNQLLVIDKTGPTPGENWKEKLGNIEYRQTETLEDILHAIGNIRQRAPIVPGAGSPLPPELVAPGVRPPGGGAGGGSGVRGGGSNVQPQPRRPSSPGGSTGTLPSPPGVQSNQPLGGPVQPPQPGPVQGGEGSTPDVRPPGGPTTPEPGPEDEDAIPRRPRGPSGAGFEEQVLARVEQSGGKFVTYVPQKMSWHVKHPSNIVESASMAAVEPPDIRYESLLPEETLEQLSDLQLEFVIYAGQRFQQKLVDGSVAGIMLGDGTGVGKGRQIAAIITDLRLHGYKKAVWVSLNQDLEEAARRDFNSIKRSDLLAKFHNMNEWKPGRAIDTNDAILYTTYTTAKMDERMKQLLAWQPDIIVFDESHQAKNAVPAEGGAKASATGEAVLKLQNELPGTRILYASATGATEPRNMVYMDRLGIWGLGTAFSGGFPMWLKKVASGGLGMLEMIARDMKALGLYVARSISFDGVEYRESEHKLSAEQIRMFDAAAFVWRKVAENIDKAIGVTNAPAARRTRARTKFYGAHLRFINALITTFKVPTIIKRIEEELNYEVVAPDGTRTPEPHSVVLDFSMTGEAQTTRTMEAAIEEGADINDLDFSPKDSIIGMIENTFPIEVWEDVTSADGKSTVKQQVFNPDGTPLESVEAKAMRQELFDMLDVIKLPDNALDQIINHFGPDKVAEISGRKKRVETDKVTGKREYKRIADNVSLDKISLAEAKAFMNGDKRIIIITPKGNAGIDLHASLTVKNQERRVHMVCQLSWQSEVAIQKLGRTHRTNQASAPIYDLIFTDIGGEKRFSSTMARKIEAMGAIGRGQRDASGGGALAKYNFETEYGYAAVELLYRDIQRYVDIPGIEDAREALMQMGVMNDKGVIAKEDYQNLKRFLNRINMLELSRGNPLFKAFVQRFERLVMNAKENGTYDEGVTDLKGIQIRLAQPPKVVHVDDITGAKTKYYQLDVDQEVKPTSWKTVKKMAGGEDEEEEAPQAPIQAPKAPTGAAAQVKLPGYHDMLPGAQAPQTPQLPGYQRSPTTPPPYTPPAPAPTAPAPTAPAPQAPTGGLGLRGNMLDQGFYRQKRSGNILFAKFSSRSTDPQTGSITANYKTYRPKGQDDDLMRQGELQEKYDRIPMEAAAEWWIEKYDQAPRIATKQHHIISGATMAIWRHLETANSRHLRVIRANVVTGERVVGVLIPPRAVGEVLSNLGVERTIRKPEDIFNAVLHEGEQFTLRDGLKLKRVIFKGDDAIALTGADTFKYAELRHLGLLNEHAAKRQQFFIPTEERRGIEVLTALLRFYPAIDNKPTDSEAGFINLDLLMPKSLQAYIDEKVAPTLEAFGVTLAGALRGIKEILVPRHGVPEKSLNAMMHLKGTRDYAEAVLSESLSSIQQAFAKMPQADQIAFMDRYKRGIAQPTADMQMLANWWRGVDANLHRIASVWRPSLAWKDNHFRIFWKIIPGRPTSRGGFMGLGRKPIQGTKGFFRHATLADVSTGIARGGIPHTYNPIDMMMMSHADVMKFVTAQKMWDQLKQMGARKFVRLGSEAPAGFVRISDRIGDVYFKVPQGMVEAGHWYVEENVGRILENYLSHDWLRSRIVPRHTTGITRSVAPVAAGIGRSILWAKNFTTSIELGLSPFHLVFETFESAGSQLGLGTVEMWNEGILKGDPQAFMRGMADALQAPIAPYTMAARGGQAIRAVRATGGIDLTRTTGEFKATERQLRHHIEGLDFARNNPVVMQNLRELFDGGLKLEMNPIYRNSSLKAFQEAIHNPNPANRYIGAMIHMLPALNQMLMKPLFQVYIPQLKVGAALQEYAQQIRENADELAAGTITKEALARKVVDSVENRFGEMNWDNLWWNRTFKSSLQVAFRSTTWRIGNMRQFAGAIGGQANEFLEPIQAAFKGQPPPPGRARFMGRMPKLDTNMGWFLGIVITTAVINTLIQTLFTGEPPKDLDDLMNPRTGGLDDRGKPNRVVSPTYLKDLAMFRRGPGRYIASGLSSIVQRLPEIWRNRDFYGNFVYDPEEPSYKKLKDMVVHVVGMPFTVSNIFKAKEQGGSLSQEVMGAVGFPRASREIDLTAAENYALGKLRDKGGMPPKTPAQQETSTAVRTLAKQLRAEQPGIEDHIRQMLRDGTLSEADEQKARKRAEGGYLEGLVKNMGIVDFLNVYELATPAEKNRLKQTLSDKELLIDKLADPQRELIRKRYLKALGFPDISHRGVLPPLPGGVNSTMTASAFRPPSSAA